MEVLCLRNCIKSEEFKGLLVDPKLAPYFGCNNQPLQINEQVQSQPTNYWFCTSRKCVMHVIDDGSGACLSGRTMKPRTINPEYPSPVEKTGGSFIAGPAMFMVTDEVKVNRLSPMSGISLLNTLEIVMSDIEERVVSMGEEEVKFNTPVNVTSCQFPP